MWIPPSQASGVTLASGKPHLGAVCDQAPLIGADASDATAYRVIEGLAFDPELIEALRLARAQARL